MAPKQSDVKIVSGLDSSFVGRIVYWWLSGDADADEVRDAWEDYGLDELYAPDRPSAERALRRAMDEHAARRVLVRPLGKGVTGYGLVEESAEGRKLEHDPFLTAVIEKTATQGEPDANNPGAQLAGKDDQGDRITLTIEPADHELAPRIRESFEQRGVLATRDFSNWLSSRVMAMLSGVPMKDRSGFYFVPEDKVELWHAVCEVIRDTSMHSMMEIEALREGQALNAVIDSIQREAITAVDNLQADMERRLDRGDKIGKRGFRSKGNACDAVLERLERFEGTLGLKLDSVREHIGKVKATVSAAALATLGDDAEEV